MERYAHSDQVDAMTSGLRAHLVGVLDVPGIPDSIYEAVMEAIEAAPKRYITWSTEQEIADEYLEAINDD